MFYAIITIIILLAWIVFRELLIKLLIGLAMAAGVVVAARVALMADARLAQPSWWTGAAVGAVVAFVVVVGWLLNPIFNLFVNVRRAGAHDRVDKEHDSLLR
jgi:hypothetical protein